MATDVQYKDQKNTVHSLRWEAKKNIVIMVRRRNTDKIECNPETCNLAGISDLIRNVQQA